MNNYAYAGFWIRFVAFFIDALLLSIIISAPTIFVFSDVYWNLYGLSAGAMDMLVSVVLPFAGTVFFWTVFGGTPGKLVLGMKVLDARTGQRISVLQAIGRYLSYFISSIFFCLGYIWAGLDARKQAWHDKLANTVVVRGVSNPAERFEPQL